MMPKWRRSLTWNTWRTLGVGFFLAVGSAVAQQSPTYTSLVDANTKFALKFLRQAVTQDPNHNFVTAPLALTLDFALLQNGTDATAKKQIADVFALQSFSSDQINEQSAALRDAISGLVLPSVRQAHNSLCVSCKSSGEHLILAESLWIRTGTSFKSEFLATNKKYFRLEIKSMPRDDKTATFAINQWIDRMTGGQLKHAIESTRGNDFLLVDTTWFKGVWLNPFNPAETHPEDFTLLSGTRKSVPMMPTNSRFPYFGGEKFQAVALNYSQATMYIFLPNEDSSLVEFEQLLTPENWTSWMQAFGSKDGFLELPKFTAEYKGDLTLILEGLGMTYPFESFRSFAPAVSNPEGAKLTRTLTRAMLRVDEKGTEVATAGTSGGVIGGIEAGPPPTPFRMIVNRPFFFAICDRNTQTILYLGAIVEP